MNFLLFLTILIPIFSALVIAVKYDSNQEKSRLVDLISKVTPIIFSIILLGLLRDVNKNGFEILQFNSIISIGFKATGSDVYQLFTLSILWLIFVFYSEKFLLLNGQNSNQLKLFLVIFMACLNLIILSQNLVTVMLAYNFSLLFFIFLLSKNLFKADTKASYIFIFLTIFEAILLFLAVVILSQFSQNLSFSQNGIIINASKAQTLFIIALFFAAILSAILSSSYLLLRNNLNLESLSSYLAFPLFLGVSKIFIFAKIITKIFGIGLFSLTIPKIAAHFIEFIFMCNIFLSLAFMMFGRDFRTIFLHLFFNQLSFSLMTIFVFAFYDEGEISYILPSFALTITLVFIGFSNMVLYLKNAENKSFIALFYDLKVTISFMIFGLLCFMGVAPSMNMVQNFTLLKVVLANKAVFALSALILNSVGLALFTYKLFFTTFLKELDNKVESDRILANKIDNSSSMALSGLLLTLIIFLLPILKAFYD